MSAPSPELSAAPPPGPGAVAGPTASSGGSWVTRMPKPVLNEARDDAVNVHQLRAGHWGRSSSYLHRIGRNPTRACQQCDDLGCPAGALSGVPRGPGHAGARTAGAPLASRARGSASQATSGRTLSSCGTAGPWRPWAAATSGTKSRGLRSAEADPRSRTTTTTRPNIIFSDVG